MDISQLSRIDPKNEKVIQTYLNQEPKSKVIFQEFFSPSKLQKGFANAPLLLLLVGGFPILFFLIFFFQIFSSFPFSFGDSSFNSFFVIFMLFPIGILVLFVLFSMFGRLILKNNIAVSRAYAVIETPTEFLQLSVKNGSLEEAPIRIPKNSIKRLYYQETPITRFSNTQLNRSWNADIYSQIMVEFESAGGMPQVVTLAQSPKYQANKVYALKSYLEQMGYDFGGEQKEILCPACNNKAPNDATFCENCGFNLSKTSSLV